MTTHDPMRRMLRDENTVNDLLALLADLDPAPLPAAFGLPAAAAPLRLVREYPVSSGDDKGSIDLAALDGDDTPVAVAEGKASAGEHRQQFALYRRWAKEAGLSPNVCWLVDIVPGGGSPQDWQTTSLADLARHWTTSINPLAAGLAARIVAAAESLVAELTVPMGHVDDPLVGAATVKSALAHLLDQAAGPVWLGKGTKTSGGGNPNAYAFVPISGRPENVAMCVDLRGARHDATDWVLRLGVETNVDGRDDVPQADRVLAYELVVPVLRQLTWSAFTAVLREQGRADLADALVRPADGRDGFALPPTEENLHRWRTSLNEEGNTGAATRVLFHDDGTRLATRLKVNATQLTGHDLAALMLAALEYLRSVGKQLAA